MSERAKRPQRGTPPPKEENKKEKITNLAQSYLAGKMQEKALKAQLDKANKAIKTLMLDKEVYQQNGKHREVLVPMGDGNHNILVQVQVAESIRPVDNIIDLVREKLGEEAEKFISTVEVLNPNALESMVAMKLVKEKDILDWLTSTTQEKLIVKEQKIDDE